MLEQKCFRSECRKFPWIYKFLSSLLNLKKSKSFFWSQSYRHFSEHFRKCWMYNSNSHNYLKIGWLQFFFKKNANLKRLMKNFECKEYCINGMNKKFKITLNQEVTKSDWILEKEGNNRKVSTVKRVEISFRKLHHGSTFVSGLETDSSSLEGGGGGSKAFTDGDTTTFWLHTERVSVILVSGSIPMTFFIPPWARTLRSVWAVYPTWSCCSRVIAVWTRTFPASQGSSIPKEPGRKNPADKIWSTLLNAGANGSGWCVGLFMMQ